MNFGKKMVTNFSQFWVAGISLAFTLVAVVHVQWDGGRHMASGEQIRSCLGFGE